MDFVNDVDAALVCFYSQGCPACDRDAVDLAGKLRLHSGTFPVTFVIVLEGSSEPMGAVANLVSIAQAKVLADEDYVYREQYELPSVPYYFFTKFGVIEWCQDGRLIDGETGENLLWLRLSGEALASSR
jgi:hypothetical protein